MCREPLKVPDELGLLGLDQAGSQQVLRVLGLVVQGADALDRAQRDRHGGQSVADALAHEVVEDCVGRRVVGLRDVPDICDG